MLDPDWKQHRPDFATIRAAFATDIFAAVTFTTPALEELLTEIRAIYGASDGAVFAMFTLRNTPPLDWFVSRNRFSEIALFEHLLRSAAFRAALPMLEMRTDMDVIEWEWSSPYVFDGDLARLLMTGGPYEKYKKSGREAKQLGAAAGESLFGDRYEEVMLFKTHKPWSTWFYGIAWDTTWVAVDKGTMRIWALCVTSTD